jgi:hypothetical protein
MFRNLHPENLIVLCIILLLLANDVLAQRNQLGDDVQTGPSNSTSQQLDRGMYDQRKGEVNFIAPPPNGSKPVCLVKPGDNVEISEGRPVDICFGGLDPKKCVVETMYDPSRKTLLLSVKSRNSYVLRFKEKCQTYRVGNLTNMPSIEIAEDLSAEQIVITPLCDGSGNRTGYEVRYGTTVAGCYDQARNGLRAFALCNSSSRVAGTRATRKKRTLTTKELMCIYFGVGCK